jgi:hypothetical protein
MVTSGTILAQSTPQRVIAESALSKFNTATVFGVSTFVNGKPVNNTGTCYLGVAEGQQPIALTTGASYTFTIPEIVKENLNNVFIQGGVGDGFYVIYY